MRVQPHLPMRPLLAMVTSRPGSALSACSAANSPAPPEPRIRISVFSRSSVMRCSERTHEEYERDHRRQRRGERRELLLATVPREILDQQHPHASQHMHDQQEYEAGFGELHQRLIAPAQEAVELRLAVDGEAEREEMQRQEHREGQAGAAVYQRREPERAAAMRETARRHGSTTAATARSPSTSSKNPNPVAKRPAARSFSGDHSVRTLCTPIAAWIAAAATKAP